MAREQRFRSLRFGAAKAAPARPGAAMPVSARLLARVPVLGRMIVTPPPKPEAPVRAVSAVIVSRLSPLRLLGLTRPPPEIIQPRLQIPLVTPLMRRVRQPLASTARVVQAAREVRKPMTRWERLREAARLAIEDPAAGRSWERLMGLGVALAAGRPSAEPEPRSLMGRLVRRARATTVAGTIGSQRLLPAARRKSGPKKTGPGKSRSRPGFERR